MSSTNLSSHTLKAMGFREVASGTVIAAKFYGLHVFAVQGITYSETISLIVPSSLNNTDFQFAIGNDVNEICSTHFGEEYSEDAAAWEKEKACSPPYLVVRVGPTTEHRFAGSFATEVKDGLQTYDGFQLAKHELSEIADRVLPSLISGLVSSFLDRNPPVNFIPVDRAVFGITPDGRTLHDIRVTLSGSAYTSSVIQKSELIEFLQNATRIAKTLEPKPAKFFQLGFQEKDDLKRFLYFFLAIEITVHKTYTKIDHKSAIAKLMLAQGRIETTTKQFLEKQTADLRNLSDRFVWCAINQWSHLDDNDITTFKRLKKIRDEIAHGSIETPPHDAVLMAQRFVAKLNQ